MALKIDSNHPLVRHYDKLIAVIVLILLLVSLFYLTSAGAARKRDEERYQSQLDALKPSSETVAPMEMAEYEGAVRQLRSPTQLTLPDELKPGFLTPERRVSCVNPLCGQPIVYAAKSCPFCGMEQPIPNDVNPQFDADKDGIPDKIELQWGLNPNDPSDAHGDLDGDGFTNLEEYLAGTDPRDPNSHPPLLDFIVLKDLRGKRLPIIFTAVNQMPDGAQLVFNQLVPLRRTFWVREGENIGETGFQAVKLIPEFKEQDGPAGVIRKDVSVAVLKRLADGKELTIRIDEGGKDTDVEAILYSPKDKENAEYTVLEGGQFKIREETFSVVAIDSEKASVTVKSEKSGQQKVIRRLD